MNRVEFVMLRGPEKPEFRAPCNGCGFCCAMEVCAIGKMAFGEQVEAPCPGLKFDHNEKRFRCEVVRLSDVVGGDGATALREAMGIGKGCDAE